MKKLMTLIICLSLLFSASACEGKTELTEPPKVTITVGSSNIDYKMELNQWNGSKYDSEDLFRTILAPDSGFTMPYIKLGEEIQVAFDGIPPDEIVIKDYMLKEDGSLKYNDRVTRIVPFELIDGICTFTLDRHMAALLSSHTKDYAKGASIRGFRLICTWGENQCEYAFVLRSDAS